MTDRVRAPQTPSVPRVEAAPAMAEVLDRAGYDEGGLRELLDERDLVGARAAGAGARLPRSERGPRATLARLLLLAEPVAAADARGALAPADPAAWVEAGLLEIRGDRARGAVQVLPLGDVRLASDWPERAVVDRDPDYVMGVGRSSLTLAQLALRRPAAAALDLGAGCGILGLLAARHSERVVAVDSNARAVGFAAFNAALNGLGHVECRQGDLLEGIPGERFDLVLSNPPFVVSPSTDYAYRDSGLAGDEIIRRIVALAPSLLREGGFLQLLANWVHPARDGWRERLASWLEGTGCDAWVLRVRTHDPASYALRWIRHTESPGPEREADLVEGWVEAYRRLGIEAVSDGAIVLRRREAERHWMHFVDAPAQMRGPCGEAVRKEFAAQDFLHGLASEGELLDHAFRVAPSVCLEQRLRPAGEGWRAERLELRHAEGLAFSLGVDPLAVGLLSHCNGQRRIREILAELGPAAPDEAASAVPRIRALVERGFLLPAG